MDIKDKIIAALMDELKGHYVRLEDDDGITGYVVSPQFHGMSTLDRQGLIEKALSKSRNPLSAQEQRQVLMIAGVTPEEYESVGARIRVHKVNEIGAGTLEILLHGGQSDAEYVRGKLSNQKGVQTTEPKQVREAGGVLMSFRAKGTEANPLTKVRAIKFLKRDRYIEVMANA
jgi:hypothetical protein